MLHALWRCYVDRFWPTKYAIIGRQLELQRQFSHAWSEYAAGNEAALYSAVRAIAMLPIQDNGKVLFNLSYGQYGDLDPLVAHQIQKNQSLLQWVFSRLRGVRRKQLGLIVRVLNEELEEMQVQGIMNPHRYSLLLWLLNPEEYGYFTNSRYAAYFIEIMEMKADRFIFRTQSKPEHQVETFENLLNEMYQVMRSKGMLAQLPLGHGYVRDKNLPKAVLSDFMESIGHFLGSVAGSWYMRQLRNKNPGLRNLPNWSVIATRQRDIFRESNNKKTEMQAPEMTVSLGDDLGLTGAVPPLSPITAGVLPTGAPVPEAIPGDGVHMVEGREAATSAETGERAAAEQLSAPTEREWDESRGGMNLIVFGAPGVGKSTFIRKEIIGNIPPERVRRVVFHPDYTNAEFVGQFMPRGTGNDVKYDFEPGPLCLSIRDALADKKHHYYLVVEEINRGPAAAIFGEAFQLLDRAEDGSSYFPIVHPDAASYIYPKDEMKTSITLPPNLSIVATMNSADQNVETLDNAFLRRWLMHLVENNFDRHPGHRDTEIEDTGVTWGRFCEVINTLITEKQIGLQSTDDKRLGVFFMKEAELKPEASGFSHPVVRSLQPRLFAAKVLRYLWDDVFRLDRASVFAVSTFEEVMWGFRQNQGTERFSVLTDEVRKKLYSEAS